MIGFLLKLFYTKGLNIIRWSNFPRIEDISPLDNTGYVIHTALFLSYFEEQNGNKIDREYLIKKIIFDLFNSLILSDINSGTRDYILKINNQVLSKINNKTLKYILSYKGGDFLRNDIEEIYNKNDKELEDNIILASKKFAGYNECLINSKIYNFNYEVALKDINESLKDYRKKLKSLDILLKNNGYLKYLSHIRRLSHCKRWSGIKRNYKVSVMSHLVITTFISYILGNYENNNGDNYDIYNMMLKSLYHDIPEAITGDIVTPIKNSVKGFREVLEKVEKQMLNDYFFVNIDNKYKNQIKDYLFNPFDNKEGNLVKKADIISAFYEAKIEFDSGNPEFNSIYKDLKKVVNDFDVKSSNYFLKEILLDFEGDYSNIDFNKI